MNNSAKCCYIILCLVFVIIILLTLTKDIIMDNNEKKIQEDFQGAGGFSGNRGGRGMGANMAMRGANFRQGNVGMRRAGTAALGGAHVYNNRWKHHRSNYYRPYFFGVPLWYWNNGSYNNAGYYDTYPNTVNYNFYDVRESDENNYS